MEDNSFQKYDSGSGTYVNAVTYSSPYLNQIITDGSIHSKKSFSGYDFKLKMPFSITAPRQSSNAFAIVYHSPAGGNQLQTWAGGPDNITASYTYYLQDSKGSATLDAYTVTSGDDTDVNYSSPEQCSLSQYTGSDTSLTMYLHSTFSDNYSSVSMICTRSGTITFRWDMQLLFNGTYQVSIPGD